MDSLVLQSLLLSALAPLAASAQVRKPVPGQPYQYWDVEDVDGGARRVYFRNDSPNPITITQLVIQRCDNTRQACGKVTVPDLPPGHRVLFMVFGTAEQPTSRRVMVRLDANGSPYDLLDLRQDPSDTASTARRTQITIDLVRQSVMVLNSGGGQSTTAFRETGTTLLTAASLGMPGETIARMVKECGGS